MELAFGRLKLHIPILRAADRGTGWEEMTAIGMDGLELARLNQANTRDLDATTEVGSRPPYAIPRNVRRRTTTPL